MTDERIGGIGEMSEHLVFHGVAEKTLTGRIYILSAYLEEAVSFAKLHYAAELFLRVSAGHISDGVKADMVKLIKENRLQISVLFCRP